MSTPWQALINKRRENIGFISKLGAFKPLTDAEKAASLAIEINSWQKSKGIRLEGWSVSNAYDVPMGAGINLKRTREPGGRLDGPEYNSAIDAYVNTPMDHYDILKAQGINVSQWERKPTIFHKLAWLIKDWWKLKHDPHYEPPRRQRLSAEFIDMFNVKPPKEK